MTNRMQMVNSFDPERVHGLDPEERGLIARRDRSMGAAYRLFYEQPVHLVRGEGVVLIDRAGRRYLDAYNNVPVVGHSNPRVRDAVARQLDVLNTHTRYLTDEVVEYAERLTGLFPAALDQVVLTCTGSEAVDLALRIARHVTGRQGVIVTSHAYHGTTSATAEISPSLGPHNPIPPTVELVGSPDAVRDDPARAGTELGERIDRAVALLDRRGLQPAAIVLDSVFSSDGLQPGPVGLLRVAEDRARRHGMLYVADEVQGGFGRTGTHWWAFERHDTAPDLVVLGKPMGNGLPIAGVVGRTDLFDAFGADVRYFNTFGGSAVSVAAAHAVLDELRDRDLLAHAETVGGQVESGIVSSCAELDGVAQVRRAGLFLAVELLDSGGAPDGGRAAAVVNAMRERSVLISASGHAGHVLKIRPPLVFPASAVDRLVGTLAASLAESRPSPT